jgi:hypothetical protein
MAELLEIITQIEDTEAAIAKTEQAFATHPGESGLRFALASLEKRQRELSEDFNLHAAARGLDVCSYRLFGRSSERPTLRVFANALRDFQELFTTVYDALVKGPKERLRVGVESLAQTSFGFGYSFTGSLGVVLTLPNERLLIPTPLDETIKTVFELARSAHPQDVESFAKKLGPAPIRMAYLWAQHQVEAGVGAEIEWRRAQDVRASAIFQAPELARLQEAIEKTSEVEETVFTWVGVLLGGDVKTGQFHMSFEGENEIRGRMARDLALEERLTLRERYRATIRKTKVTTLATGKVDETHELVEIEPL